MRLEILGFNQIYRYTPGKEDWLANGLPTEGTKAQANHMSQILLKDVPTCSLNDQARAQIDRALALGWDICVVIDPQRVVLGLLRSSMKLDDAAPAGQVMECGPRTFRYSVTQDRLKQYFQKHSADDVLITNSDGILMGAVRRKDLPH